MKKSKTIERIYLTKEEFVSVESDIRFHEHLRRYAAVRRFCYGNVLDFACGCGYGSFLLAANPEVNQVSGVDIDKSAIDWATKEFSHPKVTYLNQDINSFEGEYDTLVCLETIEHIEDSQIFVDLANRCNIDHLIFSFPDKKSTHFNPFHAHDFVLQDIADMFPNHLMYHSFRSGDVQFVFMIKLPEGAPPHVFRNIRDL